MASLSSSSSGKITIAASILAGAIQGNKTNKSDVLFLLQHRDSRRRRKVVHFDRLKPCVTLTLPEATPLEEITAQHYPLIIDHHTDFIPEGGE